MPDIPSLPVATNPTATTVTLEWDPAADDVLTTKYEVYRDSTLLGSVTPIRAWTKWAAQGPTARKLPYPGVSWAVSSANDRFFATPTGVYNKILTSPNGLTWTEGSLPASAVWKSVTYGNGVYVAVGTNVAASSTDGITWEARTVGASPWVSVTHGNGVFVAVGGGYYTSSTDGITWTTRVAFASGNGQSVAFGVGRFVAVGDNYAGVQHSTDGVNWTAATNALAYVYNWKVAYGNGRFVAVSNDPSDNLSTIAAWSPEGINWNVTGTMGISSYWAGIAYSGGVFVATTYGNDKSVYTTDGQTWTSAGTLPYAAYWSSVAGVNGFFVTMDGTGSYSGFATFDYAARPYYTATLVAGVNNFRVKAIDADSNSSDYSDTLAYNTAPDVPTLPVTRNLTAATVDVQWSPTEDDSRVTSYSVYDGTTLLGTVTPTNTWTTRNFPSSAQWYVDAVNGQFVAVGYNTNKVLTSPNGLTWTERTLPVVANWRSVTYGNGTYVAIAYSSTIAAYSTDGITWTQSNALPASSTWWHVEYGAGLFVAAARSGTMYATSPDGITWTSRSFPTSTNRYAFTYGEKIFATLDSGANTGHYSVDGITWWAMGSIPQSYSWRAIASGGGMWLAVPYGDGGGFGLSSSNGAYWGLEGLEPYSTQYWGAIAYSNGAFMAVNSSGSNLSQIYVDNDWVAASNTPFNSESVAGLNGVFIATSKTASTSYATYDYTPTPTYTANISPVTTYNFNVKAADSLGNLSTASSNAVLNTPADLPPEAPSTLAVVQAPPTATSVTLEWNPAADDNRVYRYQIYDGATLLGTTPAATSTWTSRSMPLTASWNVFSGGGQFVAFGSGSAIAATSPNGLTWTPRALPVSASWMTGAYGNGVYVAIANSTTAASSPDGINWTSRTIPSAAVYYGVTYGNGVFVAVGGNQTASLSSNGTTWGLSNTIPGSGTWYGVAYGNGTFVALGATTVAATSPTGTTWTQRALPVSATWTSVAYGNGVFVAVANGTSAATSTDGANWVQRTIPATANWSSVTYSSGLFVAVADSSAQTATSPDGIDWTIRTLPLSTSWRSVAGINGFFSTVSSTSGTNAATLDYSPTPRAAVAITQGTNYAFNVRSQDQISQVSGTSTPVAYYNTVPDAPSAPVISGIPTSTSLTMEWNPAADDMRVTSYLVYNGASLVTTLNAATVWTARPIASGAWKVFSANNKMFAFVNGSSNRSLVSSNGLTWAEGTLPYTHTWTGVAYGAGVYVAVSSTSDTVIATSPDGVTWMQRALPFSSCSGVAFGNGLFVAIQSASSNVYATSPDGITWTSRTLPITYGKSWILFGNGKFVVAQSGGGQGMVSADGLNWTIMSLGAAPASSWVSAAYGNGMFVIIAGTTSNNIYISSPDGTTWTQGSLGQSQYYTSIAFSGGVFVAVATSGGNYYSYSSIATGTWTYAAITSANWDSIAGINGFFIATPSGTASMSLDWSPTPRYTATLAQGTNYDFNIKSRDANSVLSAASPSLTYGTVPSTPELSLVSSTQSSATLEWKPVYDDVLTTAYLVYNGANLLQTITKTDTWTQRDASMPVSTNWLVFSKGGQLVALSASSSSTIAATSPNGLTWTQRTLPVAANWHGVAYGNGIYVAVANTTTAASSPDGITWTQRTMPASTSWMAAAYGNGGFVSIGYNSALAATSPDGITWTQRALPVTANWIDVAYGNGTYVAIAYTTIAATSADGITWTQRTLPASVTWRSIAYGNGTFVVIGNNTNIAATSPDGITWTQRTLPVSGNWEVVTYSGGLFVTMVNSSTVGATSPDGFTWTQRTLPLSANWSGVAGINGFFSMVAYGTTTTATFDYSPTPTYTAAITQGPTYNFTVKARDAASSLSPASNTVVFATAPDALTTITATDITPTSVTLQWDAPTGRVPATKYNVYNNTTLLATIDSPTTTYTADITPAGNYNFSVKSLDADGDISPDSPHFVIPSGEITKIVDPPAAITFEPGFNIYRNGEYIGTTTEETFTDPTPLEGFNDYTITAFDEYGNESAPSEITTINNDVTPPPVPTGLQISSSGGNITLTWQSVGGATFRIYRNGIFVGTSETTSYSEVAPNGHHNYTVSAVDLANNESAQTAPVGVDIDATAPNVPTVSVSNVGSSVTVSWNFNPDVVRYQVSRNGEIQGTSVTTSYTQTVADGSYNYTVSARDAEGNWSAESALASITVDTIPPPVPTGLAISATAGSVTFSWGATAGGTVSYNVYRNNVLQTNTTSKSFTQAAADGTYNYTVTSLDASNNESAKSSVKTVLVDTIPPSVPTSLLVSSTGSNVTLTWVGGGGSTSYHVYRDNVLVGSPTSASFAENIADGTYGYRVSALDSSNNESARSTTSTVTVDTVPPDVPVSVATSADGSIVTVTWDASAGASSYKIYRDSVLVGTKTSAPFTENVPDGTYEYQVSARDAKNNESALSASESVTVFTVHESIPYDLTVKNVGSKITLDWKAPTERDAGVHTYNVYRDGVMVSHVTRSIHNDTLADGTYVYAVSALNGANEESPKTASVAITIDTTPPPVPTGLTTSAVGSTVTAYWDVMPGAVSYQVQRNGFTVGNPTAPTLVESRTDGTYNYRVRSVDLYGNESALSAASQVIVDTDPPNAPRSPDVESSAMNVTISWNHPNTADKYRLYRNGALISSPTVTTYVDAVPSEGTYSYTVSAGDPAGNWSDQSEPTEVVIDITPTAVPVVTLDNLGREFTLDWDAVDGAVLYGIRRNGISLASTTNDYLFDVVPADGTWSYEVAAKDAYGNWSAYSPAEPTVVSTTPPPAPVAVTASPSALSTTLVWSPVPEATGYNISRDGVMVGSTSALTYTDVAPTSGVYAYTVRAKDDFGNYSNYTAPAEVTVDRYTDLTRPTVGLEPLWQETLGRDPDSPDRKFLMY